MKYIVKLELKENNLKIDYRGTFISFFKNAISTYMDGFFYPQLYQNGAQKKSFVWSVRFDNPLFKGNVMELSGNSIDLTLKFTDQQTALIYYSSLLAKKNKDYPVGNGNKMRLKSIKMIREKEIVEEIAIFKILSPICIKGHKGENCKDTYHTVEDYDFAIQINRQLKEELPYFEKAIDEIKYDFSNLKKIVVQVYGIKIPVSIGTFSISGNKKILNHMLKAGIGSKRSSGFGLVEQIL